MNEKRIICLVGPSGCGKTAIAEALIAHNPAVYRKIRTTTTRKRRPNEAEDAYFFITHDEFRKCQEQGCLLETAEYAGEMYGTPTFAVDGILEMRDQIAVVPIDIHGAKAYKEFYGDEVNIVFVFRNKADVIAAIVERDIPVAEKARRIINLDDEYELIDECDCCIINNGTIEHAVEQLL